MMGNILICVINVSYIKEKGAKLDQRKNLRDSYITHKF